MQRAIERAAERNRSAEDNQRAADRFRDLAERIGSENPDQPAPNPNSNPDANSNSGSGSNANPATDAPAPPRATGPVSIDEVAGPRPLAPVSGGREAGERPSDPNAPLPVVEPITPARLREAISGAERAIEQQSLPDRRSDLVRRVFRRYAERAHESAPPAEPRP